MGEEVGSEGETKPGVDTNDARPPRARRPYAAPRIESGAAFERVELTSHGCNEGVFDGCAIPC